MKQRVFILVFIVLLASCAGRNIQPVMINGVQQVTSVMTSFVVTAYPDMRGDFQTVSNNILLALSTEEMDLMTAGESLFILFGAINDRLRLTPIPSITVLTALRVALPVISNVLKTLFNKDFAVKIPKDVRVYLVAFANGIDSGLDGKPVIEKRTVGEPFDALNEYLGEWNKTVEGLER
jgi:hypothetical protein